MSFDRFELDSRLLRVVDRLDYHTPTPIQLVAIPLALAGHDLIGTAQTGTGKTAAFVLPILHRLLLGPQGRVRALIVTPTRELAAQIDEVIRVFGRGTRIRSATVFGGVGAGPQLTAFREGVEILVVCPGRLLDHLGERRVDLSSLEILVLDEADRMFDMGFLPTVTRILEYLPARRQTLLFSATLPAAIEQLTARALRQPRRVAVGKTRPVQTVAHAIFPVDRDQKTPLLLALLEKTDTDSVLVFTRTKHRARRLAKQIANSGYRVASLHGDRSQRERQSVLDGFKSGACQIMVATDLAARGLDVKSISHVMNYDMPDTVDAYIHRIGRTGRAKRLGDAFTLVTWEDRDQAQALEKVLDAPLDRKSVPGFESTSAILEASFSQAKASRPGFARGRGFGSKKRPRPRPLLVGEVARRYPAHPATRRLPGGSQLPWPTEFHETKNLEHPIARCSGSRRVDLPCFLQEYKGSGRTRRLSPRQDARNRHRARKRGNAATTTLRPDLDQRSVGTTRFASVTGRGKDTRKPGRQDYEQQSPDRFRKARTVDLAGLHPARSDH